MRKEMESGSTLMGRRLWLSENVPASLWPSDGATKYEVQRNTYSVLQTNVILNHPFLLDQALCPLMCIEPVRSQSTKQPPSQKSAHFQYLTSTQENNTKTTGTTRSNQGGSTGEQIRSRGRSRDSDRESLRAGTTGCEPGPLPGWQWMWMGMRNMEGKTPSRRSKQRLELFYI
jgi:hypothetical protein